MPETLVERFFDVRWFLRAGHRKAGHINGKAKRISTSSLVFYSPEPFAIGCFTEIEICLDPVTFVRGIVRIVCEEQREKGCHVFCAKFESFNEGHRDILSGTLLELRRAEYRRL